MKKIIITDGDYKHTLGIVRSLSRDGYIVDCVGSKYCLTRFSKHLRKVRFPQNRFDQENFYEFVECIKKEKYDLVIPVGAKSVNLLSENRELVTPFARLPLAPPSAISFAFRKDHVVSLAKRLGILVPKTWDFLEKKIILNNIQNFNYPIVLKGRNELSKSAPIYVNSSEELKDIIESVDEVPILQEFIDGDGVGFFAIYNYGALVSYFMHKRLREDPPSGGASTCAISIYDDRLMHAGKKILDELKWHGVAMVEFKQEKRTDALYLMEINPKFWGSTDLAIASGVNFPDLLVKVALGEEVSCGDNYKIGLKYHWPLEGEIFHAIRKPRSTLSIIRDSLNPRVKSNLLITDPIPIAHSLTNLFFSIFWRFFFSKSILGNFVSRVRRNGVWFAIVRTYSESTGIPIFKYSKIDDSLYVGAQHLYLGKRKLSQHGISVILNLRKEWDDREKNLHFEDYCHIPINEFQAPTVDELCLGVDFIKSAVNRGEKVFVHCREGVSRAPLFAIAYYISSGISLQGATAAVSGKRPFINLLPNQIASLKMYQEKVSHIHS